MALAARVLRIRPGEGRTTAIIVSLMFVATTAATIGESGIDALFFKRIGPESLPSMYLLQAGATFLVMLGLTGVLGRLGHRRAYLAAPLVICAVVVAERVALTFDVRWIYPVLWVTVALATLVGAVVLWGTAGVVVDTRQAKRLFPIFGAGGILGAVVGGLVTRPLAPAIGAENLLLVWAAGLFIVFGLGRLALGPPAPVARRRTSHHRPSAVRDLAQGLAFVRRSRLLLWMTAAAVLFSVLFYSLYLPYAQAATKHFPDADRLAGFFGLFWAAVTGAAFVVSMLVANRLFAWAGIAAMVVVLPVLYVGAFGLLLFSSGFVTLVALRFLLGVWLQGVASPAWETLVNVVPDSQRDQTRAFLNGGPSQAGTAIAGVVALVGQDVLSPKQLALIGLVAAVLTVITAIFVRRSYIDALVDALRTGRPQIFDRPSVHSQVAPAADAEAARALTAALRSPDVRTRRLAFELAADREGLGTAADLSDGLDDEDAVVRLVAVRALARGDARALARIDDPDPSVRAAAAAALLPSERDRAIEVLCAMLGDADADIRRAALEELDLAPGPDAAALARERLEDADATVRALALDRLSLADPVDALEPARSALRDPSPEVRVAAGRALGRLGVAALDLVLGALKDPLTEPAAIEALRRLDARDAADTVRAFVRDGADGAAADRAFAASVPADDPAERLLRDALVDRGRRTARAAFWAATTIAERRDAVRTAVENLDGDAGQLPTALETLESARDIPSVRTLVSVWEPLPAARNTGTGWLERALRDADPLVRSTAELVRARREGDTMARSTAALSVIERVLLLREVPLFADLSPRDLERVASVAEERGYADAEVIGAEGDFGDEMHIVIDGTIRVIQEREGNQRELARRRGGDVVGEMSIITGSPRVATLVADGPVRTLQIGKREFESMLRERPEVALGVMRILARRIAELNEGDAAPSS